MPLHAASALNVNGSPSHDTRHTHKYKPARHVRRVRLGTARVWDIRVLSALAGAYSNQLRHRTAHNIRSHRTKAQTKKHAAIPNNHNYTSKARSAPPHTHTKHSVGSRAIRKSSINQWVRLCATIIASLIPTHTHKDTKTRAS